MKVVFVTREGYQMAGARVRCYHFARELEQQGIRAQVFSFVEQYGAKHGEKEYEMSVFQKALLIIKALSALLKEGKDTVFFLQRLNYHSIPLLLVSVFKKQRIIFDCDDWNIREDPVYYFGFYPSSLMEFFTRLVARRAVACTAASVFLYDYLKQFNSRMYYLPTGVDTVRFHPVDRPDDGRVVFSWIGTAYHQEMGDSLRFVLDCFRSVADKFDNVVFSLAGEGQYFEQVSQEIVGAKHRDKIQLYSWIMADNIPEYLAGIDIGLLPLIHDTRFNRGKSPTKLFEYMSMAKPVIASNIGEAQGIISHGVNGFLAANRSEFISHMMLLIQDKRARQDVGLAARSVVERQYSLAVLGQRLGEIVRSV